MGKFDDRHGGAHKYIKVLRNDPCVWCGGEGGEIEHVTPRSNMRILTPKEVNETNGVFGRDNWQNLASACPKCNRERDRIPVLLYMVNKWNYENQDV